MRTKEEIEKEIERLEVIYYDTKPDIDSESYMLYKGLIHSLKWVIKDK